MIRKETQYGRYTIDELGRFHSYDGEPAIYIEDHIDNNGNEVNGYKAWYEHGQWIRTERNNGEVFINNTETE